MIRLTQSLLYAIAQDAANAHMRRGGRSTMNDADQDVYLIHYYRHLPHAIDVPEHTKAAALTDMAETLAALRAEYPNE